MSLYELKTKSFFYDLDDGRKLEGLDEKIETQPHNYDFLYV